MSKPDSFFHEAYTLNMKYLCQEYACFTLWLLILTYIACKYRSWLSNKMVYLIVSFTICYLLQCAGHTVFHFISAQAGEEDLDSHMQYVYKACVVAWLPLSFFMAMKFSYGVYMCYRLIAITMHDDSRVTENNGDLATLASEQRSPNKPSSNSSVIVSSDGTERTQQSFKHAEAQQRKARRSNVRTRLSALSTKWRCFFASQCLVFLVGWILHSYLILSEIPQSDDEHEEKRQNDVRRIIFIILGTMGVFRSSLDLTLMAYTWHIHEIYLQKYHIQGGYCARLVWISFRITGVALFLVGYVCMRWLDPNVLEIGGILFDVDYTENQRKSLHATWDVVQNVNLVSQYLLGFACLFLIDYFGSNRFSVGKTIADATSLTTVTTTTTVITTTKTTQHRYDDSLSNYDPRLVQNILHGPGGNHSSIDESMGRVESNGPAASYGGTTLTTDGKLEHAFADGLMSGQVVIEEQFEDEDDDSDRIEDDQTNYKQKWRPAALEEPEEEDDLDDSELRAFNRQFKSQSALSSQRHGYQNGSQRQRSPLQTANDDSSSFNYQASSNSPAEQFLTYAKHAQIDPTSPTFPAAAVGSRLRRSNRISISKANSGNMNESQAQKMSGVQSKRLAVTPTVSANGLVSSRSRENKSGCAWNETVYQYENPHAVIISNDSEQDYNQHIKRSLEEEQARKALSGQSVQQNQELRKELKRIQHGSHRGFMRPTKQILSQDRRRSKEASSYCSVGSYDSALKLNDLIQQAIFTERFPERTAVMHVKLPVSAQFLPQEVMYAPVPNAVVYRPSIKRQKHHSNNDNNQQHQAGLINRSSIKQSSSAALNVSGLSRGHLRESLLQSEHSACFVDPNQQTLGGNVHSDDAPASQGRPLKVQYKPSPLSADQTSAQNIMYRSYHQQYGRKHVSDGAANSNHLQVVLVDNDLDDQLSPYWRDDAQSEKESR